MSEYVSGIIKTLIQKERSIERDATEGSRSEIAKGDGRSDKQRIIYVIPPAIFNGTRPTRLRTYHRHLIIYRFFAVQFKSLQLYAFYTSLYQSKV